MMTSLLRPLTLSALAALLMTAPLAGSGLSTAAVHPSRGAEPAAGTAYPQSTRTATAIHLPGLPRGARPKVAWIRGRHLNFLTGGHFVMHRADGTTLGLPHSAFGQWAPMGRGVIGEFGTESGPVIDVVSGDGSVSSRRPRHFGLAVSPDRQIVGWLGAPDMTPHVVEGDGTREFDFRPVGHGTSVGAIAGARTCQEQAPEGGGCAIFVNAPKAQQVWITDSHGIVDHIGPMKSVTDVDQHGRVIGLASRSADRACFGLWRPSGHRVWQTCHSHLTAFSPDGQHVLGLGPATAAFSFRHVISLYDDAGHGLASYSVKGLDNQLGDVTWEDNRHVLASVFELSPSTSCPGACEGHWAVVRLGIGGLTKLALPRVSGTEDFPAYRLPLR